MRFPLLHTGRHFYFFTFVVEGRQPVLSRLERTAKRPILSRYGERIQACWRTLHQVCTYFTPSEAVIMPDHVHLLLMVNSVEPFHFNPLIFARWFQKLTAMPSNEDAITIMTRCTPRRWDQVDVVTERAFETTEVGQWCWSKNFWVNISLNSRQLSAIRRYIRMNPVRAFWKHDHPDRFKLCSTLKHPILNATLPWSAIGDITLLASPFLFLVRLTRKKSLEELEPEIAAHLERAQQGGIPVCGFISPGERHFEERLKALSYTRWIKTVPYGLPIRYDPSVEDSRWIAEGRELILSSFDSVQFPPFQITRAGCLLMNERILQMIQALHVSQTTVTLRSPLPSPQN